jgi:hypothetical protein
MVSIKPGKRASRSSSVGFGNAMIRKRSSRGEGSGSRAFAVAT